MYGQIEWVRSFKGEWHEKVHLGRIDRNDQAIRELADAYHNNRALHVSFDMEDLKSSELWAYGDDVKAAVDRAVAKPEFRAFAIAASGVEGRDREFLDAMAEFPHDPELRRELRGYYYQRCAREARERREFALETSNVGIAKILLRGQRPQIGRFLRGVLFEPTRALQIPD